MNKQFLQICKDFGLKVFDENKCPLAANKIFEQIYYDWGSSQLLDFMDRLMYCEAGGTKDMGIGEALFDD